MTMRAVEIIRKKRDGGEWTPAEIASIVAGAVAGSGWTDYQLAALLMAVYFRGLTPRETADLTVAMTRSGECFDWSDIPGPKVDKHSTGGVGDKLSLIVAPLAAACGVVVPMMSGRALGHTGGTLDKLEAIPGFRVTLETAEVRRILREIGMVMIGPSAAVAPADRKLYALRDVTATVESIPLITASILSKKLAEGISGLVLDVKCGRGAFMKTLAEARELARSLLSVGRASGLQIRALITAMDAPLGACVGNALEVREAVATLQGQGPSDVTELSFALAAEMVFLAGRAADKPRARQQVQQALTSGDALERFRRCIAAQGGDPRILDDPGRLPAAPRVAQVTAPRDGFVAVIEAERVGLAVVHLGGGRTRVEDAIDPAVGIVCRVRPGEQVRRGDVLLEIHYRTEESLAAARELLADAIVIGDTPPPASPLVLEILA